MLNKNKFFVKDDNCPWCNKKVDSSIDPANSNARPSPGDLVICNSCTNTCENPKFPAFSLKLPASMTKEEVEKWLAPLIKRIANDN